MFLKEATIQNFRLLKDFSLSLSTPFCFLYGRNAQGKTSILEALRLISTGRSFLTNIQKEIITRNTNYFFIKIRFVRDNFSAEVKYGWNKEGRVLNINGEPRERLSDLIGNFNTVLLTPDDFDLIAGSPDKKRKYLDIQLSQGSGEYLDNLRSYFRILKNRNALLKQTSFNQKEMDAWTEELIKYGSRIIEMRKKAIISINIYAGRYMKDISEGSENLELRYKTLDDGSGDIMNKFSELIRKTKFKEKEYGFTLTGPHRDDIEISINGSDARKYASRGQIKSIAICMKFAEIENIKEWTGYWPVMLVDDIFPELDDVRKEKICSFFNKKSQVIMTSTIKKEHIPFLNSLEAEYFLVKQGKIVSEK